jgi:hypothetical protein
MAVRIRFFRFLLGLAAVASARRFFRAARTRTAAHRRRNDVLGKSQNHGADDKMPKYPATKYFHGTIHQGFENPQIISSVPELYVAKPLGRNAIFRGKAGSFNRLSEEEKLFIGSLRHVRFARHGEKVRTDAFHRFRANAMNPAEVVEIGIGAFPIS